MKPADPHRFDAAVERLDSLLRLITYIETETELDERERLRSEHGWLLWMMSDELTTIRAHGPRHGLTVIDGGRR